MAEQIILKPMSRSDEAEVVEILRDDTVKKTYMVPDFESYEAAGKLFLRLCELSQSGEHYVRGIYLGDTLIGFINHTEIKDKNIELGWAVHPRYHNRGYCTQAVGMAIRELFSQGYTHIYAGAFEENRASMRVMEKCGMTRLDKKEEIEYRGKTHRCVFYGIKR